MNKWLKHGLLVVGVLAGVLVLAVGAALAYGQLTFGRTIERDLYPIEADTSPEGIARGEYLVERVIACSGCHSEHDGGVLSGTYENVSLGPIRGTISFSNLTPDVETGLGAWSDAEIARAIREGIGRDGRELYIMPSQMFHEMSDADVAAIVGYLRSLEPVRNELPAMSGNIFGKAALALHLLTPGAVGEPITAPRVAPEPGTLAYGEYLVTIGLCQDCHGENLHGGKSPAADALPAPDLTSSGHPGAWTEAQFIDTLRFGTTPEGRLLDPEQMHWPLYGQMTDEDLSTIFLYLRSLPGK